MELYCLIRCHYRPQTKFGARLCFYTCVSFCSQGEGEGLCPCMYHRSHDQGGLCPGDLCPGGICLEGGVCPVKRCPGGSLSARRSLSGRGVSVRETPYTVTSGRYASYWNAFLFKKFIYSFSLRSRDYP